jgi:adenine-specific DNA methylase
VPDEPLPPQGTLGFRVQLYGMEEWGSLFTPRQALALTTLARLVREAGKRLAAEHDAGMAGAVQTLLGCTLDRESEHSTSLCRWNPTGQKIQATFSRQALPMMWDFSETNILGNSVGSWDNILETTLIPFETAVSIDFIGQAESASATSNKLSDDSASLFFTDPPYYDAIPYSDLSDFFLFLA